MMNLNLKTNVNTLNVIPKDIKKIIGVLGSVGGGHTKENSRYILDDGSFYCLEDGSRLCIEYNNY